MQFISAFADSMNTIFEPDRVNQAIDDLYTLIQSEIREHRERWQNGGQYPQFMKDFADERLQQMQRHIVVQFKLGGIAQVTLNTDPSRGYVRINSVDIQKGKPGIDNPRSFQGQYFRTCGDYRCGLS